MRAGVRTRIALAAASALLVVVGGAGAHGGGRSQGYVATVSALEPNVLGVLVSIYGSANRLQVSNYSGKTVVIFGYEREPYLRFTGSRVEENVASPTAYLNTSRSVPSSVDATSKPRWRQIARGASYAWHDHRTVWTGAHAPLVVRRAPDRSHLIFRWRISATADGKPFRIVGILGWAPSPKRDGSGSVLLPALGGAAAAAGLAVTLAVGLRARRRARRRAL